jgi:hypothetical protein
MIGIKISIVQVENGFIVEVYTRHGHSKFDKEFYVEKFEDVIKALVTWEKKVNKE